MSVSSRMALVVACCLVSSPAFAEDSEATFAYSTGSTQLIIDGTQVSASTRGWVSDLGATNGTSSSNNYIAGVCGSSDSCNGDNRDRNNWFVFDLANITSAVNVIFRLDQPSNGFLSTQPSLTYTLWDTTPQATGGNGLALYGDLMSGVSYGSATVTAATNGSYVDVVLNAAGVSALRNSFGQRFALGGTVNANSNAVPEPATWAMMLLGFGVVGGAMRSRRRQRVTVCYA